MMSSLHEARGLRLGAVLAAFALLPACSMPSFLQVTPPEDGVTVKNLTADLAFGAEEPALADAPPPSVAAPAWVEALTDFVIGDFELDPPRLPRLPPPPTASGPCEKAGEGVYPEHPASTVVTNGPLAGQYRWQQTGTVDILAAGKFPVSGLTSRTIRTVPPTIPNALAAYEIEQVTLAGREIDTIEILHTEPDSPEDGVYLTRLRYNSQNSEIDFNPLPGAAPKLLSLPLRGEAVSATSVDPDDALVLTVTGTMDVSTRHRLDACGELVEAWKFTGQRALQSLPPAQGQISNTKYDFYFAPQLGGLIVGDHVVTRGSFGPFQYESDITTTIGELKPSKP